MYASTIKACRRSLSFQVSRNFATTICILAGSPSHDCIGAKLMKKIKEESADEVRFIGIGGPEMMEEGLEKSYANINTFQDKPLVPYKNHLRKHIMQVFHPVLFWLHYANGQVAAELTKNNFWQDVWDAKPKAFLTVGNEFFMKRTYKEITGIYYNNDTLKPPLIHYDNIIANQRQEFQVYCDYWLYSVPKDPVNWSYFKFPSTYVGSYAAARAIQYLYRSSPKAKHLLGENTFLLCKEYNSAIMDSLIEEERARFRQRNGISEDATVFYSLPGNTEGEIKWSIPIISGTVQEFLKKFPQYSSDNFAVVVTSYDRHEQLIDAEVRKQKWPCKVIVVKGEDEKYSALAASDMGTVVNGDAVSECAAYHVPVVIISYLSFFQAYMTLLYNSFSNNLNIALNGEAYPESLGQAFPEKIAEYWKDWFKTPSKKYDVINRFENLNLKLVPEVGEPEVTAPIETKALVDNAAPFTKYYDPEYLSAKKILEATQIYSSYNAQQPKRFELEKARNKMLTQFAGNYYFNN